MTYNISKDIQWTKTYKRMTLLNWIEIFAIIFITHNCIGTALYNSQFLEAQNLCNKQQECSTSAPRLTTYKKDQSVVANPYRLLTILPCSTMHSPTIQSRYSEWEFTWIKMRNILYFSYHSGNRWSEAVMLKMLSPFRSLLLLLSVFFSPLVYFQYYRYRWEQSFLPIILFRFFIHWHHHIHRCCCCFLLQNVWIVWLHAYLSTKSLNTPLMVNWWYVTILNRAQDWMKNKTKPPRGRNSYRKSTKRTRKKTTTSYKRHQHKSYPLTREENDRNKFTLVCLTERFVRVPIKQLLSSHLTYSIRPSISSAPATSHLKLFLISCAPNTDESVPQLMPMRFIFKDDRKYSQRNI